MDKSNMTRFFGGSPPGGPVVLRLIGLSVVVGGVILSALNLHPRQVFNHIVSLFEHIYYMALMPYNGQLSIFYSAH